MKTKITNNKIELLGIFSILLLNLFLLAIPLFRTALLPGFDSPYYLYMVNLIVEREAFWSTILSPRLIDRSLTFLVPAIISQLSGITSIISIKFFLLTLGSLQALGIYFLGKRLYGIKIGLVSSLISVLILGYLRIFTDLYANFFAISLVPFVFLFLINGFEEIKIKTSIIWILLAGILTGALFYIHNLTSFVIFFGIVTPWLLVEFFRKKPFLVLIYLLIVLFIGFPSLQACVSLFFVGGQVTASRQNGSFPFMEKYFQEFIQAPFAIAGTIGIFWLFYDLLIKRKKRSLLPLLWNFVFLGASQQQLVGLNFFPERFVVSFTQPFSLAVGLGVVKISEWLKELIRRKAVFKNLKKMTLPFSLVLVLLFSFPQSLKYVIFEIKPEISETELAVFQKISSFIKKDDVVIFSNIHHYWFQATLPLVNIEPGEFYLICGDEKMAKRLKPEPVGMSYVLSPKWDVENSAEFLNEYAKKNSFQKVFVYLNLGDKCVEVKKFEENPKYFQKVYEDQNGFRLYELLK